ncbi:GAF domain-containing protein [Flavobacteriales bacterium]|nr:GAF domain-containing protein [Flavobacteriales bacterium]
MAQQLDISSEVSRQELYQQLIPQVTSLIEGEANLIANLANVAAAIKQTLGFFWVGFYLVENDELVLGPFQGEIACTRIGIGKGVCGTCWANMEIIMVPNVDEFPGHIACSSASKSEIVVPIILKEKVVAVLDLDSNQLNDFNDDDRDGLEQIAQLLIPLFN